MGDKDNFKYATASTATEPWFWRTTIQADGPRRHGASKANGTSFKYGTWGKRAKVSLSLILPHYIYIYGILIVIRLGNHYFSIKIDKNVVWIRSNPFRMNSKKLA